MWFQVRISMLSSSIMAISTVFCLLIREKEDPVLVALLLSYIISLAEFLMYLVYLVG